MKITKWKLFYIASAAFAMILLLFGLFRNQWLYIPGLFFATVSLYIYTQKL